MDIIQLNGVMGIFILLATIASLLLIATVALFSFLSEIKNPKLQGKIGWSRHFLLSAVIFLLFDGAFFLFLQQEPHIQRNTTVEISEAKIFDERMFTIWIPCHVFGFLLLAFTFHIIQKNKLAISNYLDKFR